jgi:glycosyltransferase involved in cell wall biosynthesis
VFLHIGSFVWEKNHEFLLSIFQKYLLRYSIGYLWLVGDGKLKELMETKVKQLALEHHVVFWGARRDVASFIKSADVLLFPSVVEGVPGVILESLASGTPVLASNAGGIPEILEHDVNGHCLSSFSEDDYVNSMHTLTTDKALRSRLVAAGKETVRTSYDMRIIADRFYEFYKNTS